MSALLSPITLSSVFPFAGMAEITGFRERDRRRDILTDMSLAKHLKVSITSITVHTN